MGIRSILSKLLSSVASTVGGFLGYNATDPRRKMIPQSMRMAGKSTANQLLSGSLPELRTFCRHLERNNPTARAAVEGIVALVVGKGIRLEPDTGDPDLDTRIHDYISRWFLRCGVHGESIYELEALAMREEFVAGEALWRLVPAPGEEIPLKVLPLDAEWLDDTLGGGAGLTAIPGLKLNKFGVPTDYILTNPEIPGSCEEVPAKSIIHMFERRRPIQHRGEPWLSPVIETLINERDLVDAELKAAVDTSTLGVAVTSDYLPGVDTTEEGDDEDPVTQLSLGSVVRLNPGDKVEPFHNPRPCQQIAPFRDMLRGDAAAALRVPRRFLDRDISKANYSSMRADNLDTERTLCPVQERLGHQSIGRLYREILPIVCARLGVPVPRSDYKLIPDGQPYVDPLKDAAADLMAIAGGLATYEDRIGRRGKDYRKVWDQRIVEQALAEMLGLELRHPAPENVSTETDKADSNATES